jgi:hypothetical protein
MELGGYVIELQVRDQRRSCAIRGQKCRQGEAGARSVMEQQAMAGNASPTPPTSSASTGSLGGTTAGGNLLTSTADSIGVTGENSASVLPPRRRLGKIAA